MVGCSSSEVLGGHIGRASSREAAEAVFAGIHPVLRERGVYLAAQCCEHLNRALIIEAECAREYGYEPKLVGRCGLTALAGRPGPTILLRADMDALLMDDLCGLPYQSENPRRMSLLWA